MDRRRFLQGMGQCTFASTFLSKIPSIKLASIELPDGFSYFVISKPGEVMSDGYPLPKRPDGMACFPSPDGGFILLRNQEVKARSSKGAAFAESAYDEGASGGVTRVVLDKDFSKISESWALTGTVTNCSGGVTPWGTWLTCEESTAPSWGALKKPHGYVFEVDPLSEVNSLPQPIREMGRFVHEAAAVSPETNIVYLTEHQGDSCFYRFIPNEPGDLQMGGQLQALAIEGQSRAQTRDWGKQKQGLLKKIHWVDLENVDTANDDLRYQAHKKGAALFSSGEGVVWHPSGVYFTATDGGPRSLGQIFKLTSSGEEEYLHLELVSDSSSRVFSQPDNIAVNSFGDLLICEDKFGTKRIRGIRPDGKLYTIASNRVDEWAGICFSPDGKYLFANIQGARLTIAITGPWESLRNS